MIIVGFLVLVFSILTVCGTSKLGLETFLASFTSIFVLFIACSLINVSIENSVMSYVAIVLIAIVSRILWSIFKEKRNIYLQHKGQVIKKRDEKNKYYKDAIPGLYCKAEEVVKLDILNINSIDDIKSCTAREMGKLIALSNGYQRIRSGYLNE